MGRHRTIQYAFHRIDGHIISRVRGKVAIPDLQYQEMSPANNFKMSYRLTAIDAITLHREWDNYVWTRKIPLAAKQEHRKFWGMKPLKRDPLPYEFMVVDAIAIQRSDDIKLQVQGSPGIWDCGKTIEEAKKSFILSLATHGFILGKIVIQD